MHPFFIALVNYSGYPAGIKVSETEFKSIQITRNDFHGEWNYRIDPRSP